jgi:NDP-sugar pyrophosphorylase family protein
MKAVVLAGGKGTRLVPYTASFPKPLMPLGDVPILEVVIRQLSHFGIVDLTLAVGHLAELLMAYFGNGSKYGVNIVYSKEDQPLGTAGPLGLIAGLDRETFLVMNGDVLTDIDYRHLVDHHRKRGAAVTVAIHRRDVKVDLGVIEINERMELTGYIEKPTLHYLVSMGIYVFEPRVLTHFSPGERIDLPVLVRNLLENGEKVVGYPHDGYWLDIGRPDDYERAAADFKTMRGHLMHASSPGNESP